MVNSIMVCTPLQRFILSVIAVSMAMFAALPSARAQVIGRRGGGGAGGTASDRFALTVYSSRYANTNLSSASASTSSSQPPANSLDVELAIRLQTIFALTLLYSKFDRPEAGTTTYLPDELSGIGMGMKIDLPGFFFLFGKKEESAREGKKYPINTFLFGEIMKTNLTDVNTGAFSTTTTPRYGFGFDTFLFQSYVFLSGRGMLFNVLGVTYFGYSGGLGLRF